jgi:hypothetical protein
VFSFQKLLTQLEKINNSTPEYLFYDMAQLLTALKGLASSNKTSLLRLYFSHLVMLTVANANTEEGVSPYYIIINNMSQ